MTSFIEADPLDSLRTRTSSKWSTHPDDVLPLFVAEMDYPLFPPIAEALIERIAVNDLGYLDTSRRVTLPFARFAERRWGWAPDPAGMLATTDVSVVVVESLRATIAPGDGVIVMPPVYPPFFDLVTEAGGVVVEVPLRHDPVVAGEGGGWGIDLGGVGDALAAGATAILLCSPHNPLGLVHPPETLAALAELARQHGATVVSDEIHAPLALPGSRFTPFLAVSDAAREVGIAAHSASKAFNIAGLKCAIFVAEGEGMRKVVAGMPEEVEFRAGKLGVEASAVAFDRGDEWLDRILETIDRSADALGALLAEHLPRAVYHRPRASYLGWVDVSAYGWGDDPAAVLLERARVALGSGPAFGLQGRGHVRVNLACSPELLAEALRRIAAVA